MIYEPREDSFLLQNSVGKYSGCKALDMGTGSGIIANTLKRNFKRVVAVDINPEAIKYCKKNYEGITFKKSNLFSNINGKFDLITFNAPYLPNDPRVKDVALDGGKKGNELIIKFLKKSISFLKNDGRIILLFSSLSHSKDIFRTANNLLLKYKLLNSLKIDFEELFVYEFSSRIIGRGKRGLVYQEGKYAVKIINSKTDTLKFEADILKKINKKGIGPKLYSFKDNKLKMELIKGERILDFLKKASKSRKVKVLKQVFKQLRILDLMKINKSEMKNPYKHIIIGKKPVLIDFERARYSENPQNITQFCSFLESRKIVSFRNLPKKYKEDPSEKNYKKLELSLSTTL
jgi:release factor glutamine methyltransferase